MSSKNNGFTASDIERYHSGQMLPEEMHALEKAALDDPFLADALEGYTFTTTAADDIAKIQSRLDEKPDRKKVIPFFQRYKWLNVAAIVLIIAGAGWFAYNISQKQNTASVTALEKKNPVNDSNSAIASPQTIINDSSTGKNNLTEKISNEKDRLTITNNNSNKNQQEPFASRAVQQSKQVDGKKVVVINNADVVSKAVSTPSQNEIASTNNGYSNSQRGFTKMNNAAWSEPRLNNASNNVTDKGFFYKKADSNNADLAEKTNKNAVNDSMNLNIVLKPLPTDSLKEVVIVGYGAQKKSAEKYPHVVIDTLEPEEGYVHFDDYVASNLKTPEEIRNKPVSGEVQLSFDVDKDGQPTNISVVKSLCQKCDEEAIRLLKEGPKWKKKKNKKGIITIRF
jgi:TonB family protein